MMINKKSQLGHIISAPIVFIFVALVMFGFIVVAAGISILHKPSPSEISKVSFPANDLLLQKIKVQINNQEKEILVIDALILYENDKLERNSLENELKRLLDTKNNCLAIAKGPSFNPIGKTGGSARDDFFIVYQNNNLETGTIGSTPLSSLKYKEKNAVYKTSFKNNKEEIIFVEYYIGGCK